MSSKPASNPDTGGFEPIDPWKSQYLMLKSEGSVWSDESFDHIIRHAEGLAEKLEYVRQNPVTRGLIDHPDRYSWLFIKSITS